MVVAFIALTIWYVIASALAYCYVRAVELENQHLQKENKGLRTQHELDTGRLARYEKRIQSLRARGE